MGSPMPCKSGPAHPKGDLLIVPSGGDNSRDWIFRFAELGIPEFHFFDRDVPLETSLRWQAAAIINLRSHCLAVVTLKRSLENYLHPDAIFEARCVRVECYPDAHVADAVAAALPGILFDARRPLEDGLVRITSRPHAA
jgi:hypothetical protein